MWWWRKATYDWYHGHLWHIINLDWPGVIKDIQGIVDGSASKPALVQDTSYMVEKAYHIALYLCAFGAYLMPQWPIYGSNGVSIYQNDRWNMVVNIIFFLVQKPLVLVKNNPKRLHGWENLPFSTIFRPFWGQFNA